MKRLLAFLVLFAAAPALAQVHPGMDTPSEAPPFDPARHFSVYAAGGDRADLDAVVDAMALADVVFLGEIHNDPTAHALQRRLLEAAHRRYGATRPVALALEMFERDVQLVLDEYLAGLIRERDFLAAARPWGNYTSDYRQAIEYAKAHGLPVVATNAPGRYVSRVGREGLAGLSALAEGTRPFLPPLPIAPASVALAARFEETMADMMAAHGAQGPSLEGLLAAQNLRDAAMAYSLAEHLWSDPGVAKPLVLHLNGAFHSEGGLGIPEHLARYASGARVQVVTFRPADDFEKAPDTVDDDFVILTDRSSIPER